MDSDKPITIYGVEYPLPDSIECTPQMIDDYPLTEEEYHTFLRGYAPDWDSRFAPFYYNGWLYITRSGWWLKKFRYIKQLDGLYRLTDHFTAERESDTNLVDIVFRDGYFRPSLRHIPKGQTFFSQQ